MARSDPASIPTTRTLRFRDRPRHGRLWLGGGPVFEPMAIAILFGLVFGTVLTLGLVPIPYALFFRVRAS